MPLLPPAEQLRTLTAFVNRLSVSIYRILYIYTV